MDSANIRDVIIFLALASTVTATAGMSTWLKNKSTMGIHRDRVLLNSQERYDWNSLVENFYAE